MRCCSIQFAAIFLAFQCIQGTFRDTTKRAIKRHHDGIELFKTSVYPFSRGDINDDQDIHEVSIPTSAILPGLRARRQNTAAGIVGDPEAYTYYSNDDHQYARVNYLGEGSKVIVHYYVASTDKPESIRIMIYQCWIKKTETYRIQVSRS